MTSLILYIKLTRKKKADSFNITTDETAVWQDMLSSTTVDNAGEKSIRLKTAGHEKSKVSVCLAAKSDGTKLKLFIVFPGAKRETKQLNEKHKNKCYLASSVNGWMNDDLTRDWVQGVLGKFSSDVGLGLFQMPHHRQHQARTRAVKDRSCDSTQRVY